MACSTWFCIAMQLPLWRMALSKGLCQCWKGEWQIYQMILQYHAWRASHFIHSFNQSMGIYKMRSSECPSAAVDWSTISGQLLPAPHSAMLLPSVTLLVSIFTAPAISRPFVLRPDSVFLDSYLRAFGEPSHDHWFISDITFSHFCVQITSCHLGTICSC